MMNTLSFHSTRIQHCLLVMTGLHGYTGFSVNISVTQIIRVLMFTVFLMKEVLQVIFGDYFKAELSSMNYLVNCFQAISTPSPLHSRR